MNRNTIDRITDLFAYMSDEDFLGAYNDYAYKKGLAELYKNNCADLDAVLCVMGPEEFANALEKSNFRKDQPFFTVSNDYVFASCYLDGIPGIDGFAEYAYSHYDSPDFHAIADDICEIVSECEGWEAEEKELQSFWYNSRV